MRERKYSTNARELVKTPTRRDANCVRSYLHATKHSPMIFYYISFSYFFFHFEKCFAVIRWIFWTTKNLSMRNERERETQRKKEGESESERRILFSADFRCVRFSSFERFYVLFCCANNVTKTVWKIKRILLVNAAAAAVIVSVRIESEYLDLVFVTAATILAAYARVLPNFTTHSAVAAYVFEYFQNCFYYIFFSLHFPFRFTSITLHSIVFFLLLFSIRFSFF